MSSPLDVGVVLCPAPSLLDSRTRICFTWGMTSMSDEIAQSKSRHPSQYVAPVADGIGWPTSRPVGAPYDQDAEPPFGTVNPVGFVVSAADLEPGDVIHWQGGVATVIAPSTKAPDGRWYVKTDRGTELHADARVVTTP